MSLVVFEHVLILVFPAVMAFGAAMDLLTMTIPNRITLGLAAAFFFVAPLMGLSIGEIMMHVAVGSLVLIFGILLFAVGGFGGGDAKLLAAAALWIGLDQLVPFLTYVTLFGGALAIAILLYRSNALVHPRTPDWAVKLHKQGTGIPYGIAIASSALLIYPHTSWFASLTL